MSAQLNDTDTNCVKQILHDRGICVVIPTFNNIGSIRHVVEQTLFYCYDVIVVSDGSTDGTTHLLETIQEITLVSYERNRGKGYALKQGFKKALELGFAYAITLDGDGQHYPEEITKFLDANQKHPGTLIVGERDLAGVVRSKGSDFANKFSNFWFYLQTGCKLKDTQTGFRLYPLKKLYGLSLLTSRYEAELELMVFASWHGVELYSIPINVFYPSLEERVSHFRPITDFLRITILNTFLCGFAIIYGLPLRLIRLFLRWCRTFYALFFFVLFSMFIVTPLFWIYLHVGKVTERKKRNLHKMIFHIARFVMMHHGVPGTSFSIKKVDDKEDFGVPAVIICNHQSHLDLMCQLAYSPNIVFLTNDWVWNNPFYGFIIHSAEYLPVKEGVEEMMPKLRSLVKRGYSIAIYPEGTRSKDCSIGRFHKGAFYLAKELKLDVLPMVLYGTGKVLPKKTYHLRKGIIEICANRRFSQQELERIGDDRVQARFMREYIVNKYNELCNRIEQFV